MPTPLTQRPPVPSPRYRPASPPLQPQQSFPPPPPTTKPHQLTITLALTPHPGGVHRQQHMKFIPFAPHRYRLQNRLLLTQRALPEAHRPHALADELTISRQRRSQGPISDSTSLQTLSALKPSRVYTCERINYTSTPPQHTLKPTASSCSLGPLENEYVQEGRDKDLPLECLHFPINSRFTERFWHLSR